MGYDFVEAKCVKSPPGLGDCVYGSVWDFTEGKCKPKPDSEANSGDKPAEKGKEEKRNNL